MEFPTWLVVNHKVSSCSFFFYYLIFVSPLNHMLFLSTSPSLASLLAFITGPFDSFFASPFFASSYFYSFLHSSCPISFVLTTAGVFNFVFWTLSVIVKRQLVFSYQFNFLLGSSSIIRLRVACSFFIIWFMYLLWTMCFFFQPSFSLCLYYLCLR
jgi:hypothetical protein